MLRRLCILPLATSAILLQTGCTDESVRMTLDKKEVQQELVSAKYRAITTRYRSTSGDGIVQCAEPSADVAAAMAKALTAKLEKTNKESAEASYTSSENLLKLTNRTETIQLLRDNLFRACEAYGNGAIDKHGYGLILSGIGDELTTLVAIEAVGKWGGDTTANGLTTTVTVNPPADKPAAPAAPPVAPAATATVGATTSVTVDTHVGTNGGSISITPSLVGGQSAPSGTQDTTAITTIKDIHQAYLHRSLLRTASVVCLLEMEKEAPPSDKTGALYNFCKSSVIPTLEQDFKDEIKQQMESKPTCPECPTVVIRNHGHKRRHHN